MNYKNLEKLNLALDTLTNENCQLNSLLNKAKHELHGLQDFDGLSLVGGIKALIKTVRDQRDEIFELQNQIKKYKNRP